MLPSGSTRPDQPSITTWKLPPADSFCSAAYSVGRSDRSKPASEAMACTISATDEVVVLLPNMTSALTRSKPACLSSARALATSRLVTGNLSLW
ncbi:Uncharacterised protein [Achromobacter ruhlandii]|nr:Uncharacterised protein [Achromobacter ruhlandii]CUK21101.1 Uncharacterised protein [Achromobacter ruhlandii]